jgi:hypothetical protein
MNLNSEVMRQRARVWSARLGRLSAERPASGVAAAIAEAVQPPVSARLPTILENMQREHRMNSSDAKFRAHEFIMSP